jgi:hypothetical protein
MITLRKAIVALALTGLGLVASSVAQAETAPSPHPAKVVAVVGAKGRPVVVPNSFGSTWS